MKKDYDSTRIYRNTQKKGASQTYDTPSFAFRHLNTLYSCCIPTLKVLQSGHCAVSKHFGGIGVFIEYQDFFRNGFRKISSPFINFKIKATDASRTDGFKAQLNFMKTQPSKDSCL